MAGFFPVAGAGEVRGGAGVVLCCELGGGEVSAAPVHGRVVVDGVPVRPPADGWFVGLALPLPVRVAVGLGLAVAEPGACLPG